MAGSFPFIMNIRQRVFFFMAGCLVAITAIGGFSYSYLSEMENIHRTSEITDDISNNILEIRRSEKNFFFYGSPDDLVANHRYTLKAIETIRTIMPELKAHNLGELLGNLKSELDSYDKSMDSVEKCIEDKKGPTCAPFEENVREKGKNLILMSQELVTIERQKIFLIIAKLKTHMIYSILVLTIMGGFLAVVISRKIVRPLKLIEKATHQIAQGNFDLINSENKWHDDEAGKVVVAFNKMISELEKRQEQLIQAQKLSSIGIMAAGIAHQLNNPLNNISTSCQIVLEELDEKENVFLRQMLENSEHEVQRARDIVRGLLEFSRSKEFSLKPSSLRELASKVLKLVAGQIPPCIEIKTDIPDITLNMDQGQMQEAFINIILNAAEAIGENKGEISISAKANINDQIVLITVDDTGPGILDTNLSRIFDPFFTTKETSSGTGLGLSIVYGIIKQHSGKISAECLKSKGARFIVELPLFIHHTGD